MTRIVLLFVVLAGLTACRLASGHSGAPNPVSCGATMPALKTWDFKPPPAPTTKLAGIYIYPGQDEPGTHWAVVVDSDVVTAWIKFNDQDLPMFLMAAKTPEPPPSPSDASISEQDEYATILGPRCTPTEPPGGQDPLWACPPVPFAAAAPYFISFNSKVHDAHKTALGEFSMCK